LFKFKLILSVLKALHQFGFFHCEQENAMEAGCYLSLFLLCLKKENEQIFKSVLKHFKVSAPVIDV
jgi:hypothetical protein